LECAWNGLTGDRVQAQNFGVTSNGLANAARRGESFSATASEASEAELAGRAVLARNLLKASCFSRVEADCWAKGLAGKSEAQGPPGAAPDTGGTTRSAASGGHNLRGSSIDGTPKTEADV